MLSLRSLAAILFCSGSIPGLAQDNPWRLPGYGASDARQSYAPRSDNWNSGSPTGPVQPSYQGGSGVRRPDADAQVYPRDGWSSGRDMQQPSGSDQYAATGRPSAGYGATPSAPYWNQSPGRYAYPDTNGNYANPGYTMPSIVQPQYLYGRQFGEFPPLEGKERTPGAESLPSQAPPARQAAPGASGYGASPNQQTAPPVYGYGSGYPGTASGGPSALAGPLGGYAPSYGVYGIPYGIGVPGPYGW